jgi:thiamine-monophosphate kinase
MEFDFLQWLRPRLPGSPQLHVGPGDDAAVIRLAHGTALVATSDLLSDGVDFELGRVSPRRIGHKALAVNLSDLAAMAARPVTAVVSLLLPRIGAEELARELYEGILPLAEAHGITIAGGDTNTWDGKLAISITALGETTERGSLLRSGAKPGDRIVVTGKFGGSILGRHLDVEPRVQEALWLHANHELHAGIDCSDGLAHDLAQICEASGCGAVTDLDQVPIADAARQLALEKPGQGSALEHALRDGEDFELILAVPKAVAAELIRTQPLRSLTGEPVLLTDIGEFVNEAGLWSQTAGNERTPLSTRGFEH